MSYELRQSRECGGRSPLRTLFSPSVAAQPPQTGRKRIFLGPAAPKPLLTGL